MDVRWIETEGFPWNPSKRISPLNRKWNRERESSNLPINLKKKKRDFALTNLSHTTWSKSHVPYILFISPSCLQHTHRSYSSSCQNFHHQATTPRYSHTRFSSFRDTSNRATAWGWSRNIARSRLGTSHWPLSCAPRVRLADPFPEIEINKYTGSRNSWK